MEYFNLDVIISVGYRERDILTHAGKVSHEKAIRKARTEFEAFRALQANQLSPVEKHFLKAIKDVKKLKAE